MIGMFLYGFGIALILLGLLTEVVEIMPLGALIGVCGALMPAPRSRSEETS